MINNSDLIFALAREVSDVRREGLWQFTDRELLAFADLILRDIVDTLDDSDEYSDNASEVLAARFKTRWPHNV